MTYWVLKIIMIHGYTTYPYKFIEMNNCHKVGKDLTKVVKDSYYTCKKHTRGLR